MAKTISDLARAMLPYSGLPPGDGFPPDPKICSDGTSPPCDEVPIGYPDSLLLCSSPSKSVDAALVGSGPAGSMDASNSDVDAISLAGIGDEYILAWRNDAATGQQPSVHVRRYANKLGPTTSIVPLAAGGQAPSNLIDGSATPGRVWVAATGDHARDFVMVAFEGIDANQEPTVYLARLTPNLALLSVQPLSEPHGTAQWPAGAASKRMACAVYAVQATTGPGIGGVVAQLVRPNGALYTRTVVSPFQKAPNYHLRPRVDAIPGGRWLITWLSSSDDPAASFSNKLVPILTVWGAVLGLNGAVVAGPRRLVSSKTWDGPSWGTSSPPVAVTSFSAFAVSRTVFGLVWTGVSTKDDKAVPKQSFPVRSRLFSTKTALPIGPSATVDSGCLGKEALEAVLPWSQFLCRASGVSASVALESVDDGPPLVMCAWDTRLTPVDGASRVPSETAPVRIAVKRAVLAVVSQPGGLVLGGFSTFAVPPVPLPYKPTKFPNAKLTVPFTTQNRVVPDTCTHAGLMTYASYPYRVGDPPLDNVLRLSTLSGTPS